MELHNLKKVEGSDHSGKRVGRGLGSGMGKTSTPGARSGGAINPGFEGGQTPLYRRLPKRGFKNINHKDYAIINVEDIAKAIEVLGNGDISLETLMEIGMIKDPKDGLKVLGDGEIKLSADQKFKVTAKKFTSSAAEKIAQAGGEAILEK